MRRNRNHHVGFRPCLEVLEDRRLLAQVLFGGDVLKETFDDPQNLETAPGQFLSSGPPTSVVLNAPFDDVGVLNGQQIGPVFHHTVFSGATLQFSYSAPLGTTQGGNVQGILSLPAFASDIIAIKPFTPAGAVANEISLVAIDVAESPVPTNVIFFGQNGAITLQSNVTGTPPALIVAQGSTVGVGSSGGGFSGFFQTPSPNWDTLAVSENDPLLDSNGNPFLDSSGHPIPIGQIQQIEIGGAGTKSVDNLRALVFFPGIQQPPPPPVAPVVSDIHFSVPNMTTGTVTIPNNASVQNNQQLTTMLVDGNGNAANGPLSTGFGTVTLDAGGNFVYTSTISAGQFAPVTPAGLIVADSFSFEVVNSQNQTSNVAQVFVEPVNHPPVANNVTLNLAVHQSGFKPITGQLSASDPDNDPLAATLVPGSEVGGTVQIEPITGVFALQPNGSFNVLPGLVEGGFQFQVTDPYGLVSQGTVDITVPDVPPTAVTETLLMHPIPNSGNPSAPPQIQVDAPGIFRNVSSPFGDPLSVMNSNGQYGTISVASDGTILYTVNPSALPPGVPLPPLDSFNYTLSDGFTISNPAIVTLQLDTENKGVSDIVENGDPNQVQIINPVTGQTVSYGDGNHDGIPDIFEPNVASLPDADGDYVTIESPTGTYLRNVQALPALPPNPPAGIAFPVGLLSYEVHGVAPGGFTTVTLWLPAGVTANTYWKFGPEPGNLTPHWYDFTSHVQFIPPVVDPIKGPLPERIVLNLTDGQSGDDDVNNATNGIDGVILEPGSAGLAPPPTAMLAGPTEGVRGQPLPFTASASDASPALLAAGFTYTVDWGDGSPVQTSARQPGDGAGVPLGHVYTQAGTYTVTLTAADEAGLAGTPITETVTIDAAGVIPDPIAPGMNMLAIGGTPGNDIIRVMPGKDGQDSFEVLMTENVPDLRRGWFFGDDEDASRAPSHIQHMDFTGPVDRIAIYGQSGNDVLWVSSEIQTPAWLFGGDGNDVLIGGGGPNILVGGNGKNRLIGGRGRNILIGGSGADTLFAGPGSDLLIAGTTAFDADEAALAFVMAEWNSDHDYETRTANLLGTGTGPRLNGDIFLIPDQTVFADNARDRLIGGDGRDWFFADLARDRTTRDILIDRERTDLVSFLGGTPTGDAGDPDFRPFRSARRDG